ncbi:MAG: thioredoxin family protein [Saprospiraceae bacterium]
MEFRKLILAFVFLLPFSLLMAQNDWQTNLENAVAQAKTENKSVLLLFTGSDWCPPCKMLEKNVFSSETFEKYAADNLILVKADFPRKPENKAKQSDEQRQYNTTIQRKFMIRGFPTTIILDNEGKELDRTVGYPGLTPDAYIEKIEQSVHASTN